MTTAATDTTTTTTTTAADAAVAASATLATDTDAAAKAAADKVTADAAAAAANAGKTAEQLAAEKVTADKAAADKATADKATADAAAEAAKKVVPDKYDLKLPDGSKADPAVVERTAAIARELGLSQDNAQKALAFVASEVVGQVESQVKATMESYQPGGAEWKKQDEGWRKESLADPELGANKPEELAKASGLAKRVLATFGDKDSIDFLEKTGLGSHPAALRLLVKIGRSMSEASFVKPSGATVPEKTEATVAAKIYDNPTSNAKK